jgi:hypothetical protein
MKINFKHVTDHMSGVFITILLSSILQLQNGKSMMSVDNLISIHSVKQPKIVNTHTINCAITVAEL